MKGGIIAEYADKPALLAAIRTVRGWGFTSLEAFTPYPVLELDDALGVKRSPLALAAGIGGLVGALSAYALQWFLVAYLYPIDAGSRPPHMPLPFVIITIEMGFLFGALTVTVAFLIAARLVKLWDPVFDVPGFESATRAGFWLAIGDRDPLWDHAVVDQVMRGTGARHVHPFGIRR